MGKCLKALIVEDEVFVVLDVEDALYSLGIDASASFSTIASALEWLETNTPDLAIIDYRLKDGTSELLAETLGSKNIPFLVYSGNSYEPSRVGTVFQGHPWLDKPTYSEDLKLAICRLIGRPE